MPAEDANERATEIVRAALRSQSPRLHLTPPEKVVVLNVTGLTEADNHGRVTMTLSSGATVHCRIDDVRTDSRRVFLRTVLTEEISKANARAVVHAESDGRDPKDAASGAYFQLDTKGVDFTDWMKSVAARRRANWYVPYAVMSLRGHAL